MNTLLDKFDILSQMGFKTPPAVVVRGELAISEHIDILTSTRDSLDYDIDGIIWSINSIPALQAAGISQGCPNGQIAYKFPAEGEWAVIRDIEWSFEGTESATPVGIYDPILLKGAECTRVSLKSYAWMKAKNIGIGSMVRVVRSGDVIPTIPYKRDNRELPFAEFCKFTPDAPEMHLPSTCPHCSSPVVVDGAMLACSNASCFAKEAARINKFLKALKVKGLDVGSLREYAKAGVTLADFFIDKSYARITSLVNEGRAKSLPISLVVWSKVKAQLQGV